MSGLLYLAHIDDRSFAQGFNILGVDTHTGASTLERAFAPVKNPAVEVVIDLWTPVFTKMSFDPQFHRVTATYNGTSDASAHVGWVTDTGTFVDVTAAVSPSSGGFSGQVRQIAPTFGPDGSFYFIDSVAGKVMKVTSKTPSSPSDAVAVADTKYSDMNTIWVWPSGTVVSAMPGGIPQVENKTPDVKGQGRVEGWINDNTMLTVSTDFDRIFVSDGTQFPGENGCFGSGSCVNSRDLLPVRAGRLSWNPVPSPDGSTVAFLSALAQGTDPVQLFTVPAAGGEPQQVPATHLPFTRPTSGYLGNSGPAQLIGWY